MTNFVAIVPVCIMLVWGCALQDTVEVSNESAPVAPSLPLETESASLAVTPAVLQGVSVPRPQIATADDVRRMQMRLREVGFDPGPADGMAGVKTKLAFTRLQAACTKLDGSSAHRLMTREQEVNGGRIPARDDVMQIQSDLRNAGFNPGPIDGLYGARTKALVSQVPIACRVAKEFSNGLDGAAEPGNNGSAARSSVDATRPSTGPVASAGSDEKSRSAMQAQAAQPREDIRILQLRLRDAGFDPGPFDGVMGAKTRAALAQYEASQKNSKVKTSLTTTRISGQY